MHPKTSCACCALLTLLLALLPGSAIASPRLETATGTVVAAGTVIKGSNVGETVWTSSFASLACPKSEMTGKVIANSGTKIEITIESLTFSGTEYLNTCTTTINQKFKPTASTAWCLQSTSLGTWTIRGGACGSLPSAVKMVKDIYEWRENEGIREFVLAGECKYERKELTGTNNTGTSPLILKTNTNQSFITTSGIISLLCPEPENLDLTQKLQTSAGAELKVT